MSSNGQIPAEQIVGLSTAVAPTTALVPLTTVVGGVPELVWDADNNLVMTEVPL